LDYRVKKTKMGRASSTYGVKRGAKRFWWGNLREENHLKNPGVDGRITLKWILQIGMWGRRLDRSG
jgi:hypothetical protein